MTRDRVSLPAGSDRPRRRRSARTSPGPPMVMLDRNRDLPHRRSRPDEPLAGLTHRSIADHATFDSLPRSTRRSHAPLGGSSRPESRDRCRTARQNGLVRQEGNSNTHAFSLRYGLPGRTLQHHAPAPPSLIHGFQRPTLLHDERLRKLSRGRSHDWGRPLSCVRRPSGADPQQLSPASSAGPDERAPCRWAERPLSLLTNIAQTLDTWSGRALVSS